MNVTQKEIVLINYPFSDLKGKRVDKIFTVEKRLIAMSIGFVNGVIFDRIGKELSKIL